jgi:hypothetical protein
MRCDGHANSLGTIWLPTKAEALSLLKYYMDNVQYLHPVINAQAVQQLLEIVYTGHEVRAYRKASHIALLLSIFASTGYLWSSQGNDEILVFASPKAAIQASSVWSDAALDILDYSRHTSSGSIENIQATIITSYLIYCNKGFSAMFRLLHSNTIAMARDLSLHKLDSPKRRQKRDPEANIAEDETKRRIWWYVVSTDW